MVCKCYILKSPIDPEAVTNKHSSLELFNMDPRSNLFTISLLVILSINVVLLDGKPAVNLIKVTWESKSQQIA